MQHRMSKQRQYIDGVHKDAHRHRYIHTKHLLYTDRKTVRESVRGRGKK